MAGLEGKLALVIQALRHLGEENVGAKEIETMRSALSLRERQHFLRNTRFSLDWIHHVAKQIAEKTA